MSEDEKDCLIELRENTQKISELEKKYKDLEERYRESGGLKCVRDRGLIKEVLRELIINVDSDIDFKYLSDKLDGEKEPTEYGLSEKGLEAIEKIHVEWLKKKGLIGIEKADLEYLLACTRKVKLIDLNKSKELEEKYLKEKK